MQLVEHPLLVVPWQGLGKTITAAALILKTQGLLPSSPTGAAVTWLAADPSAPGPGRRYYLLANSAASSASMLQAARGGAARRGGDSMRRTRSSSAALMQPSSQEASQGEVQRLGSGGGTALAAALDGAAECEGQGPRKRARLADASAASAGDPAAPPSLSMRHLSTSAPAVPGAQSGLSVPSSSMGGSGLEDGEGSGPEEGAAEDPLPLWVECHFCKKWRRMPQHYQASSCEGPRMLWQTNGIAAPTALVAATERVSWRVPAACGCPALAARYGSACSSLLKSPPCAGARGGVVLWNDPRGGATAHLPGPPGPR